MSEEKVKTLPEILGEIGLTCEAKLKGADTRDGWECDVWDCVLKFKARELKTEFRTGAGWRAKLKFPYSRNRDLIAHPETARPWQLSKRKTPSAADIISSLCLDAQSGEETFSDFCGNMGYSEDSRKALEVYLKCQEGAVKIRRFLGDSVLQKTLAETEY
jgi:hypothetical protein